MKVIIAGSRDLSWADTCLAYKQCPFNVTEIVSGGARGPDQYGEIIAEANAIPCKIFPADWDKYGKSAGYKRNVQMAEYADALLAIWDGKSKGTQHMINIMKEMDKPLMVYSIMNEN